MEEFIKDKKLIPLFNDLKKELNLKEFASSNDIYRFLISKELYNGYCYVYESIKAANNYFYPGVDKENKMNALIVIIESTYTNKLNFYENLAGIIIEFETSKHTKVFMGNIMKDLQLLDDFENKKQLFKNIGTMEERTPDNTLNRKRSNSIVKKLNSVFIVHGHDNEMKLDVARTIEKLGFEAIILNEKTNEGETVIEKFEKYSEKVGFAVILLSPDDVGNEKHKSHELKQRARQNVIFELGYFIAKLGRSNVCALYKEEVEIPSDISGVLYVVYNGDGWKFKLADELIAAGYKVDKNKL